MTASRSQAALAAVRASRSRLALVAVSGVVLSCASGSGAIGESGATPSGQGQRDDRTVIGRFSDVQAVSVSRRHVFTATSGGIGVMDRIQNTWLPPLPPEPGIGEWRVSVMAADPVEDAVWFGYSGSVFLYRPATGQLQRTPITGIPDIIVFDRASGTDALVRASGQWTRVSRTGVTSYMPAPPATDVMTATSTLTDVYRQYPALRSQLTFLLREPLADRSLPSWSITSGALSPDRGSEVWIGTNGDGLWRVDPNFQQATPLRYGLLETGVGAVVQGADGVWSSGLGDPRSRGGITFASNDLQRWRWISGTIARPMTGLVANTLAMRGSRVWLGSDRGVYRVRTDAGAAVDRWSTLDGLPSDDVLAVAPRDSGAWVGTARGLAWIADSNVRDRRTQGIGRRLLDGIAVTALEHIGDTLWIGTSDGLFALPGAGATLARPRGADPLLRRTVRAMAWSDTLLLVATDDAMLRIAPRANAEPARLDFPDLRQVGRVTGLALDDRAIWLTGSEGALIVPRNGATPQLLRSNRELPGPALDVALSREWGWIATPGGLVRLRRAPDGGVP